MKFNNNQKIFFKRTSLSVLLGIKLIVAKMLILKALNVIK